jgi:hypothetical protein
MKFPFDRDWTKLWMNSIQDSMPFLLTIQPFTGIANKLETFPMMPHAVPSNETQMDNEM